MTYTQQAKNLALEAYQGIFFMPHFINRGCINKGFNSRFTEVALLVGNFSSIYFLGAILPNTGMKSFAFGAGISALVGLYKFAKLPGSQHLAKDDFQSSTAHFAWMALANAVNYYLLVACPMAAFVEAIVYTFFANATIQARYIQPFLTNHPSFRATSWLDTHVLVIGGK